MEEGNEYLKLSVEEQCVHKLWKARVHGYEGAATLFQRLDDEKSPEFSKYLGLVKKFVIDSNAAAQEKGLEAVLAFVENSAVAGKTVGDVMNGIVGKCIAAPKVKTKELAVQITLMYIEIEKFDAVQEELLKGMEHKNPKIVSACVAAMTLALKEFGTKVINIKPLVKKVPVLLEDRDKSVREEGKIMTVEMYRWIGAALQPQLKDLKPVQVTELETEFDKVKGERVSPTRFLRSQQQKQAKLVASGSGDAETGSEGVDVCDAAEAIDPYDLMVPVDILSKLSKDFYEKVEAKKWQERKEAVDGLEQLLQAPKLENGDYGDLVRALKKIITKDSNVVVIAIAAKCLALLANGLKKRFQPYASACIPAILEKFREKKQNVVTALKEAIDAIFVSTTVEAIQEDVLAALDNKNPSVKIETAAFLARCFTKCTPTILNKKILKAYSTSLLKLLNDPDPSVRENSAEALGTAMKVVGEKAIMPFMADIEPIKKTKIKECCDKAVIMAKISVPKASERPNTAPASLSRPETEAASNVASVAKSNKRPASSAAPAKKTGTKKQTASVASVTSKADKKEREMSSDEVDEKAAEIFPDDVLVGLGDANWKTRLSSVEQFVQVVNDLPEIPAQLVIRVLNKKPGLKDTNFQVLKARLEALKMIAEKSHLSSASIDACVIDVAEKLGDAKNGALAAEVLTTLSESSKLDLVGSSVLDFAFNQKSPKVQQEALNWLSDAIREFGFVIQPKGVVEHVKKALAATMPAVRTAGIQFVGILYLYMGPQLANLFENEKPALKQLIQAEFDKREGEFPPNPTRGAPKKVDDKDDESADLSGDPVNLNVQELMPRVDISSHITESLLTELRDKNWKVRIEALQKLENILKENKYITNNLGELPDVLAQRLLDSNSNIAKTAIAFCQVLGTAMGSQCKNHVHVVFPSLLQSLSDNKQWIRSGAISCANAWGEQCGFKEFFKNEMVADALKSDSPNLRAELWSWLAEKLPDLPPKSFPKEELVLCLPHLYANLEDRNADVRKNAQECVLPFMLHLNYTAMAKATEKMKPGSKVIVMGLLEKVRGSVPTKVAAPVKEVMNGDENSKSVKTAGAKAAAGGPGSAAGKGVVKGKKVVKSGGRKKDEETDTCPFLQNNNLKHQRTIDEQKLKVLKWNFTTPREEFVELLRDQMTAAGVNKNLLANMFHSDFRYHLKAIDILSEDLPANGNATIANLDLILKWMTLRFFDTNPSVLIKGLEYLQLVFNMLIEEGYNMFENEAASFIPYLILKIGDPKDAVRNSVKTLFRQMEQIYPLTKLFGYIMEGLKSKNARQRTECLDLLGFLIESYGVNICNPSPAAALKEIAKQISDRDNSVRNAALNCVVQAYFLEGEKVYKMVGQISDKDLCLLEERIKRAAKNRQSRPVAPVPKAVAPIQQPVEPQQAPKLDENNQEEESDEEEVEPPPIMRNIVPKPRPVSGPFGLDTKLLEQIEGETMDLSAPKLQNFDLAEIWESPLNIPKTAFCGLGSKRDSSLPTALITAQPRRLDDCTSTSQVVDLGIANIASADLQLAWQANVQMERLLNSDKASELVGKEDSLIKSCCVQLKLLQANSDQGGVYNLGKGYRTLLMLIIEFFDQKQLCSNVSEDALIDLVENLLTVLVSGHVEKFEEGYVYVRILNTLMLRIIECANHTNVTCAFLQILHKCSGSNNLLPRYGELTLKCLWRIIKFLPEWEGDLDITMVLFKIHHFLKDYPSATWKKRESDTPIRTVKTILHTITKMVGGERILQYVGRIDNLGDSELQPYLHKLVKKIKAEESKTKPKKPPHRLSKVTHEQLSEIFKKIGARENTREGLELLYDFREQHPEADIEPFLKKSSQFFQDYIERNLRMIDAERKKVLDDKCANFKSLSTTTSMSSLGMHESGGPGTPFSDTGEASLIPHSAVTENARNIHSHLNDTDNSDRGTKGPLYYLERLRALQAQAGICPSSVNPLDPLKKQEDVSQDDANSNKQQLQDDLHELHSHSHNTTTNTSENCAPPEFIEDIRKRLDMFKQLRDKQVS